MLTCDANGTVLLWWCSVSTSRSQLSLTHPHEHAFAWPSRCCIVRWLNSTLENMTAGESRTATLRVSVPNGEAPGDYGFLLSAGSAMGNFTISETIVVRVNGTHNLTFSATDSTSNWLPNATGMVDFDVYNAGTSESESLYSISATGVCSHHEGRELLHPSRDINNIARSTTAPHSTMRSTMRSTTSRSTTRVYRGC